MKDAQQIKLPNFYFSFLVFWLRLTGVDVLEKEEKFYYKLYSAFWALYALSFILLECIELKFHKDFNSISILVWYLIIDSITLVKIAVIYKNRKEIGNLMRSFHEGSYKPDIKRGGEFEVKCIHRILKQSHSQTIWYGIVILMGCVAGMISSLITRITETSENWKLPYISISFININYSPVYEIMFVYQGLQACIFCGWTYLCDCAVTSIIAQIVAQLKILEGRFRNCRVSKVEPTSINAKGSVANTLRTTVEYHVNILKTINEVELLYSYLALSVFASGVILLCSVMYNASMTPLGSLEFVRYLGYTAMIAGPLFMYCWWGNEMTLASEALSTAVFEAYHPDDVTSSTKMLNIVLVKAQKPLFLTAGKFVPLSLETFKSIMKGSFSYFTVLRQVNSE